MSDTRIPATGEETHQNRESDSQTEPAVHGLIGWFATNHVAANLLMFFIIAVGIYALYDLKKETMPDFNTHRIQISMSLRGGTPEEVEKGILIKIENAVQTVAGIKEIRATASEGSGRILLELEDSVDLDKVLNDVKLAVDGINNFPAESEKPIIQEYIPSFDNAINVQVSGDIDEIALKELTEQLRNEVLNLDEVSYAETMGARPYEIAIEVSEKSLRQYGLSLEQVSQVIRQWSVDLPGGSIRSEGGDIRVRARNQSYTGEEFENIVLLTREDGTRVLLGDIAQVNDGFAEVDFYSFFNGKRSMGISVKSRSNENEVAIAAAVKQWVEERRQTLPESVSLTAWADSSFYLKERMDMMLKNLGFGALLVFIMLGIFLRLKIAAWVVVGLPVAFFGALMFLSPMGLTINIISLFGFMVVIGIVVDDAIIIAESADAETDRHGYSVENIVRGAQRVAVPATFGVLTTVAAFAPMVIATGPISTMTASIGWVVVLCLLFSLVESKLILPSHLALMKSSHGEKRGLADWVDSKLQRFVNKVYLPGLRALFDFRYAVVVFFVGLLVVAVGLVFGGAIRQTFFPEIENDYIMVEVKLLDGSTSDLLSEVIKRMDSTLWEVNEEIKQEFGTEEDAIQNLFGFVNQEVNIRFQAELAKSENRELKPSMIANRWRAKVGEIAGTEEMRFRSQNRMGGGGSALNVGLSGPNSKTLEAAADDLVEYLKTFDGLYDVRSNALDGPNELRLRVKPEGEAAGLTLSNLARQVRNTFFGLEAQRIQRGQSEVRVIVRYPENERTSVGNLESMWVTLPDGSDAPFYAVAEYVEDTGYGSIRRVNGNRNISVTAEANYTIVQPQAVLAQAEAQFLPQLAATYSDVKWALYGTSREERMGLYQLGAAFLAALLVIYALMAIPLKSYIQPLVIMCVIPFGIIGAILGHLVMNWIPGVSMDFNMVSMIGCIALSGVVVNDSLILVHYVNRKLAEGSSLVAAILRSGKARFRAILLTSVTTFFGLVPILLERSFGAQLIAPMAVSMAFGIVFATVITLVLIPMLLRILADIPWYRRNLKVEEVDAQIDANVVPVATT